jgi:alpha-L-arabinofuranosidase
LYLGEYAAHIPGRQNTIETALAEAIYLTALERNADVVQFSSYAPLLAKDRAHQLEPRPVSTSTTRKSIRQWATTCNNSSANTPAIATYPSLLTLSNPDEASASE